MHVGDRTADPSSDTALSLSSSTAQMTSTFLVFCLLHPMLTQNHVFICPPFLHTDIQTTLLAAYPIFETGSCASNRTCPVPLHRPSKLPEQCDPVAQLSPILFVQLDILSSMVVAVGEKALHLQGDFTWEESAEASLTDLDAAVNSGDLMVVVGPTGSGKSSLLGAALGLMQQVSGSPVNLRGKASTCTAAQLCHNVWLMTQGLCLTHTVNPVARQGIITVAEGCHSSHVWFRTHGLCLTHAQDIGRYVAN